jgi:TolB-like protein
MAPSTDFKVDVRELIVEYVVEGGLRRPGGPAGVRGVDVRVVAEDVVGV